MGRSVLHWVCVCVLGVAPLVGCGETTRTGGGGDGGSAGTGGGSGGGGGTGWQWESGPTCEGNFTEAPQITGRLENDAINEASGMVRSPNGATHLWLHNDSGDTARVFAVGPEGQDLGIVDLNDAVFVDAEDIAGASCPDLSAPCLWVGDFGNNFGGRVDQTIYVIEEPAPEAGTADIGWRLPMALPDSTINVEAMVVFPDASGIVIIVKEDVVRPDVYYAEGPFADGVPAEFERVGTIEAFGVDLNQGLLVTAADLHPSGTQLLLRTYTGIGLYELDSPLDLTEPTSLGGELITVFTAEPQGEAISFDDSGMAYWTVSERANEVANPPLYHFGCQQ